MENLKIGQVVSISTLINKRPFTLCSTGFTDQNVFIHDSKALESGQHYRNSLFVVLPTGNFEMHDEQIKMTTLGTEEIKAYESRLETQKNLFQANIQSNKDNPVTFGSEIILKHIDSESYLSGCFECSQGGIGGFKIILTERLSSQIIFRVESYQSFLKEGDSVFVKAPLYIFNPKTKCYLASENNSVITFSQKSCVWSFEKAQELHLVYLQHTRVNGYLSIVDGQLRILSPKESYNIYEPIWVDRGNKITRLDKELTVQKRIRSYVDISIDAAEKISEGEEYKVWSINNVSSLEDCFEIIRLEKSTHKDILFITSTKASLNEFTSNMQANLNYNKMMYVKGLVDKIIDFLTGGSYVEGRDDYRAVTRRQYLMRDLGSLDQILTAIHTMYSYIVSKYLAGKKMEDELGHLIFVRLYKCVEICCFENERIKIYMTFHLKRVFTHCLNIGDIRGIIPMVTSSMPPHLDLQEFSKDHEENPLLLNFLSLLSKNPQNHPQIYRRLNERWSITEWVDLKDKRWRYSEGSESNQQYLEDWIQLCSRICSNRNLRAQKIIEKNFSLKNLMLLIRSPQTQNKSILRRFVALLHHCYVNTIEFNPVILDRLCEYNKLDFPEACISKTHKSVAEETISFINEYLEHSQFDPKDLMKNQNLLEVLSLLDRTIVLGFWPSVNSLNQLLEKLMVILRTNDPQLMATQRRQNLLTIKVKHFILTIINTIINFQQDIRVKALTHKFKLIYDSHTNIQQAEWISAMNQTLEEWHLIGPGAAQIDFCYTLVELSQYPNVALLSSNLAIILRLFSQKAEIHESFQRIYLLKEQSQDKSIEGLRQIREKFFILGDPTLKHATLSNQTEYGTQIWSPNQKNKGLITHIWELASWMKSNACEKVDYQKIGQEEIFEFFNERQVNQKRHQEILKALEIHGLLLKFLVNMEEVPTGELARKLMYVIYYYLTLLVWNSLECKNEIVKYLTVIKRQLLFQVGAIDLLRELFDNNPGLLYNHVLFEQIVETVLDHVAHQPVDYYSSKMLDMLRCTLYYNEKTIQQNQVFLLSKLQEYRSLLVFRAEDLDLRSLIQEYDTNYRTCFETLELEMGPQLTLAVTLFNLLGILIEDNNKINVGKCTQIHPFYELLKFSVFAKRCWPLKRNLRSYLNKLYYSHDDYNGIMQLIKIEEFDNLLYDLDHFIALSLVEHNLPHVRMKNPIRFTYLQTFVYLNIEEVLISLHYMFTNKQMLEYVKKHLARSFDLSNFQSHLKLMRLIERLQFIKIELFFGAKLIRNLINRIVTALEGCLSLHSKHIEIVYSSKIEGETPTFRRIIEACKRGDLRNIFMNSSLAEIRDNSVPFAFLTVKNEMLRMRSLRRGQEKSSDQHPLSLSPALLKIFKGILSKRPDEHRQYSFDELVKKFNHSIKNQLNNQLDITFSIRRECPKKCKTFCDSCLWMLFKSDGLHDQKVDNFVEYVKVLIRENFTNSQFFGTDLKIFLFKMIEALIYSKRPRSADKEKSNGPVYWTDEKQTHVESTNLKNVQYFLKECGTHRFICSTIINCELETELELACELFRMAIAFLMDGNTHCQNALLEEMQTSENNRVLRKLNDLIVFVSRKIIDYFKVSKTETVADETFRIVTNDTYDFFDLRENRMIRKNVYEPDTDKQIKEKEYILKIFCNVFEFLHLLCENNNVEAKKFIKFQGNPRNSVNLLETAVVSLRKMLKIMNAKIIDMPAQLLSFINETTQLPCLDNQIFIAKSTLFEDITTMEEVFAEAMLGNESEQHKEFFGDTVFTNKIQSIYEEFINILLSISEGNTEMIYNEFQKMQSVFFVRVTYTYLRKLGVTLKDPMDIFQLEADSEPQKEFEKLIASPEAKDTVDRILKIQILARKIQNFNSSILKDFVKFFKSPYFEPLPRLIQIEIEGQQQFFCPEGTISTQTKTQFIQDAPRTTQREKIVYLMKMQYTIFNELEFRKTVSHEDSFKLASQIVAILINIIICLRDVLVFDGEVDLLLHRGFAVGLFDLLKYAHFVLGLAYVVVRIKNDRLYLLERYKKTKKCELPQNKLVELGLLMKLVYRTPRFNQMVFTLVSSAIAFSRPTLYSIHVFTMFARIESLESVFEAINKNIQPLTVVGVFGVAFFYIFSLVSLGIYSPTIYESWEQDVCTNWIDCILDLYISGTINSSSTEFQTSRFILDLVYFIFFGLLFGNIVSGLMTDTFKELRSQQDLITFDEDNCCYVCGVNRQTLQRNGQILNDSYRTAANKDQPVHEDRHNRFNYLYYIYMLRTKDKTDFSGLEYEVMSKIKAEDMSWLPSYERTQEEKDMADSKPDLKTQAKEIMELIDRVVAAQHFRQLLRSFQRVDWATSSEYSLADFLLDEYYTLQNSFISFMQTVIARTYVLKKKLGSGAFGEIFLALNIETNQQVAVKCEPITTKHPQLFYEAKLINYLNSEDKSDRGIPRTHLCCTEGDMNILVMDLLGPSLEDVFNLCGRKMNLKSTLMIAIQMLERIEFVHRKQFLHRDVKPDNFLMGVGSKAHRLYLIDFGLAKKYVQKDGIHISYRDDKNLTGTARYASLNTHLGIEQGRRDDLEGVANVLIYLIKGYLPWQNLKAANKKEKYQKIMEKKLGTPLEVLCKDIPTQFRDLLVYSRNLEFEDEPDYGYLKGLFSGLMAKQGFEMDYKYQWDIQLEAPIAQQ